MKKQQKTNTRENDEWKKNKEKQEKARQNNQHTWHIYIKLYDTGC